MLIRYLPVRERAMRAVQGALQNILQERGFNFDVRKVHRKRNIPERCDEPPEIFLMFGKTIIDQNYNAYQNKEYAQTYIWYVMQDPEDNSEDLQYSLFMADMIKCLDYTADGSNDVIDRTHPEGRIVDVIFKEHIPRYADTRDGFVIGRLEVEIQYIYLKTNPYRWDLQDVDPGVPLEE